LLQTILISTRRSHFTRFLILLIECSILESVCNFAEILSRQFLCLSSVLFSPQDKRKRFIGSGGFGKVYLTEELSTGTQFVSKIIPIQSADSVDMVQKEMAILKTLQSPFIVQYVESYQKHGSFYIVMEFCDKGDLKDYITLAAQRKLIPTIDVCPSFRFASCDILLLLVCR
jgi:hypothetical protein